MHAFFPLYPSLVLLVAKLVASLRESFGLSVWCARELLVLAALVVSNAASVAAALVMYALSRRVLVPAPAFLPVSPVSEDGVTAAALAPASVAAASASFATVSATAAAVRARGEALALAAALLFAATPASVFFSAAYTESLYALLSLTACLLLHVASARIAAAAEADEKEKRRIAASNAADGGATSNAGGGGGDDDDDDWSDPGSNSDSDPDADADDSGSSSSSGSALDLARSPTSVCARSRFPRARAWLRALRRRLPSLLLLAARVAASMLVASAGVALCVLATAARSNGVTLTGFVVWPMLATALAPVAADAARMLVRLERETRPAVAACSANPVTHTTHAGVRTSSGNVSVHKDNAALTSNNSLGISLRKGSRPSSASARASSSRPGSASARAKTETLVSPTGPEAVALTVVAATADAAADVDIDCDIDCDADCGADGDSLCGGCADGCGHCDCERGGAPAPGGNSDIGSHREGDWQTDDDHGGSSYSGASSSDQPSATKPRLCCGLTSRPAAISAVRRARAVLLRVRVAACRAARRACVAVLPAAVRRRLSALSPCMSGGSGHTAAEHAGFTRIATSDRRDNSPNKASVGNAQSLSNADSYYNGALPNSRNFNSNSNNAGSVGRGDSSGDTDAEIFAGAEADAADAGAAEADVAEATEAEVTEAEGNATDIESAGLLIGAGGGAYTGYVHSHSSSFSITPAEAFAAVAVATASQQRPRSARAGQTSSSGRSGRKSKRGSSRSARDSGSDEAGSLSPPSSSS